MLGIMGHAPSGGRWQQPLRNRHSALGLAHCQPLDNGVDCLGRVSRFPSLFGAVTFDEKRPSALRLTLDLYLGASTGPDVPEIVVAGRPLHLEPFDHHAREPDAQLLQNRDER